MSLFDQPRTLDIVSPALPAWQGAPLFTVSRLAGKEKLGKLFDYTVDLATTEFPALSVSGAQALVDVDRLVGKTATVHIAIEGAGMANLGAQVRELSGVIAAAQCVGADERRAHYRLRLRPWLWLATLTRHSRIFQDSSVMEISEAILNEYPYVYESRLVGPGFGRTYPKRDYQRQYWESDFAFLTRIWQEWGITFHFENGTLVLCDSPGSYRRHGPAYQTLRYQDRAGQRIDEEHVHQFRVARALTTGKVTLTDYDYTRSLADLSANDTDYSERSADNAQEYGWGDYAQPLAGAMGLSSEPNDARFEAEHLARVRLEAHRAKSLRARGRGNLRGLMCGATFRLEGYPLVPGDGEYLVVSTRLEIVNNDTATSRDGLQRQYSCKTRFSAQPANTFFRTPLSAKKPHASGEVAVVTSPGDYPMWTDRYGRVLVRFMWERTKDSAAHYTSCWMRVSSPWHGAGYGAIWIPRAGHEVVIGYHDNDPDRPFVLGRHTNEFHEPPWKLPDNHALSGWRSQSLEGLEANSVVTDDTPGELQVQVASDQAQSRLALGRITLIDGHGGRSTPRGEGFELASGAHGVIRANRGLLLTTEARDGAQSPLKDMGETVQRLTQAREQHEDMAQLALRHGAQSSEAGQHEVTHAIRVQNDAIRGGVKAHVNPSPEMTRPDVVVASSAGIATSAAGSTHMASHTDHAVTAGGDVSFSAGRSLLASVRGAISLFAYQLGLKLIAARGKIEIQAQSDELGLAALKDVTVSSTDGRVVITASKEVWIGAGGSYIRINGSQIENCSPGQILERCTSWEKDQFGNTPRIQQEFFESQQPLPCSQQISLDETLLGLAGDMVPVKYHFIDHMGRSLGHGALDQNGKTLRVFTETPQQINTVFNVNGGKWTALTYQEHFAMSGNSANKPDAAVFDYADHETDRD
ncbi:type VI secretion system Vgr family protein [Paraburkholderia phenoliruptrix]|uniref:type VI secretion system Vgr family protein n=1 Tax=Paraburkholderia phenoliruptrix TaxID=252970 RepID=UPI0028699E09|nr:type VI secretion system Vgr family protein [Paraburkholderia phenoliruptrix]WMY08884.1 type VI secretion system Vgr family protein [Paraburkholderia phenoliruptrix]